MAPLTDDDDDTLAFLASLQLADSFFPSGLYTLSHGLEAFAQAGLVRADTLEALQADYLRHGVGPADGVALACAHRAAATGDLDLAARADARLTAVKLPREAREVSVRTGRQLLALAGRVFGGEALGPYAARVRRGEAPGNHAVALGLAMATLGISRERAVAGELYAFAASGVGAAVRMAAIDHRAAQVVLHRLKPVIAAAARDARDRDVPDIAGCVPLVDVMAMRHEQAEVRLFMS
ncbi:MAG TPA: urease accessory UreF family protein [Thermomicrobiales bacterium]|nr:urease accessory UreF family protein [Thermomicrobiales bacterium]